MQQRPNPWFRASLVRLDRALALVSNAAQWLVLPLALLLFAQWPLRDWVQAYSREANDLAQLFFSVYIGVGITMATRQQMHLTPDVLARRYPLKVRHWLIRWATLTIVVPWALFILYSSAPIVWHSLLQLERFPDTFNPGYFMLKLSMVIFSALILMQALIDNLLSVTDQKK